MIAKIAKSGFFLFASLGMFIIAGCSDGYHVADLAVPLDPNKVVEEAKILSERDGVVLNEFPLIRDYEQSQSFVDLNQNDQRLRVDRIVWTPSKTSITMSALSQATVKLHESVTRCAERMLLIFCARAYTDTSSTHIQNGSNSYSMTVPDVSLIELGSDMTEFIFEGVPISILSEFSIKTPDFSTNSFGVKESVEKVEDFARVSAVLSEKAGGLNIRQVARLANRYVSHPKLTQVFSEKLIDELKKLSSVAAYSVAISELEEAHPIFSTVSDDFLLHLYRSEVATKNDSSLDARFIDRYKSSSGAVLKVAFEHAVGVEMHAISKNIAQELNEKMGVIAKIFGGSKSEHFETVARKYYSDTIRAKDAGDMTTAAIRRAALMRSEELKGTNARFSLEMDKELKEALSSMFDSLIDEQRKASQDITSAIHGMSENISSQVGGLTSELSKPVSVDAEWQANQRFLWQQKIFDETVSKK